MSLPANFLAIDSTSRLSVVQLRFVYIHLQWSHRLQKLAGPQFQIQFFLAELATAIRSADYLARDGRWPDDPD